MKKMLSLIVVLVLVMCCGFEACLAASGIPGLEPNTMIIEQDGEVRTFELETYQLNDDYSLYTMFVCTDGSGDATGICLVTVLDCGVYSSSLQTGMKFQYAYMENNEIKLMAACGPNSQGYDEANFCLYVSEENSHYCGMFFTEYNGSPVKGMFDIDITLK